MIRQSFVLGAAIAFLGLSFFQASESILAASFYLTKIGSLEVTGLTYKKWYYTGRQPRFVGVGPAGETVEITLDGESFSTEVAEDNTWSFTPPVPLALGEHSLTLTAAGSLIDFTLVITAEVPAGIEPPVPSEVPVASFFAPTVILALLGSFSLGLGFFLLKKSQLLPNLNSSFRQ